MWQRREPVPHIVQAQHNIERQQHESHNDHHGQVEHQSKPGLIVARHKSRRVGTQHVEYRRADTDAKQLGYNVIEADRARRKIKLRIFHSQHEGEAEQRRNDGADNTRRGTALRCQRAGEQKSQRHCQQEVRYPVRPLIRPVVQKRSSQKVLPLLRWIGRHEMQAKRPENDAAVNDTHRIQRSPKGITRPLRMC